MFDAARQDFEDGENAHYDRQLILKAEHWDYYPDGEYVENPYQAEIDARTTLHDEMFAEFVNAMKEIVA